MRVFLHSALVSIVSVVSLSAANAGTEVVVAARALPASTVITKADLAMSPKSHDGGLRDIDAAVGMETRVTIYAGRPVSLSDLRPAALVERNEIVAMSFERGALSIQTEGRALDRGAKGDRVRVMNLSSRTIVTGEVTGRSLVAVSR